MPRVIIIVLTMLDSLYFTMPSSIGAAATLRNAMISMNSSLFQVVPLAVTTMELLFFRFLDLLIFRFRLAH